MMVSSRFIERFGVTLYICDITSSAPGEKRRAEREAVLKLVHEAFGPDVGYTHDADGAPVVEGVDSYISVSHCSDRAVLAVRNEGPVGVDIERFRPQIRRIARKFLTDAESAAAPQADEALLRLWAAKEAVFKAASDPSLTVSRIEVDLSSSTAVTPSGRLLSLEFLGDNTSLTAIAIPLICK